MTEEQQTLYDNMTDKERKHIDDSSSMTAQQAAFTALAPDAMVYAWARLSDTERDDLRDIYETKINHYILTHDLNTEEMDKLNASMDKAESRR